jgi:2,3-dihydroxybenzoate decarboxylase
MKIIDFETHFFTDEFIGYMRSRKEPPNFGIANIAGQTEERMQVAPGLWAPRGKYLQPLLDMGEGRIAQMDAAGVSVQVLSLSGPGCELFEPAEGTVQAMKANDTLADAIRKRPDRFSGFAALAPQDPKGAARELERSVRELGFKGANINSHVRGGEYLDDEKYWGVFEKAVTLGVPIYLHPRIPSPQMLKPYADYGYALAGATLGFGAETTLHAVRLILSGVFDRYPTLKIILGHMGEALPFWMNRLDRQTSLHGYKLKLQKKPSEYIKNNFFITFSGMFFTPAFMCAYLGLGAENILFASDYPLEPLKDATEFLERLPISDSDKEKICYGNARTLLKLA